MVAESFSTGEAVRITGVSFRNIDFWARTRFIVPSVAEARARQKAQAETLHRRALDILERRLGTQHPSLLPSLYLMLDLYRAASLQNEVDKIQQRIQLIENARGA